MRIKYLAVIISIFSIVACSQIKDFNDNQLENKIISEYKNWANQGITSYRAKIEESSVWYSLTITIEVNDNQVVKLQINCGDATLWPYIYVLPPEFERPMRVQTDKSVALKL